MKPTSVRARRTSLRIPGNGARSARIVWRGLRVGKKVRRSVRVRVVLKDTRGRSTALKKRVRVRGRKKR